ncbi:peptidoglycan/LPS O-acetylase OafA/YrhL [Bacilli bacterium PM5-9]|nr:peptidoglycan/LPS O-acetylase OafA/YrhL [Bacilli bacterium PM5-9]
MRNNKRIEIFDIIKGISAIFIIITHFVFTREQRLQHLFPFYIDTAVPFYMMITGYFFYDTFEKVKSYKIRDFYKKLNLNKRIGRLLFPYLFIIIIEIIIFIYIDRQFEVINIINKGGWGPGSYYTFVSIQIVFMAPIIYFLFKKNSKITFAAIIVLDIIYNIYIAPLSSDAYRMLSLRYIIFILLGIRLNRSIKNNENIKISLIFILIGFIFILGYNYLGYTPKIYFNWSNASSFPVALYAYGIVFILYKGYIRFEKKFNNFFFNFFSLLGKASYHIFLFQMLFYGPLTDIKYNVDGLIKKFNFYPSLIICIIICLIGGLLFYYFEQWIRKKINKK